MEGKWRKYLPALKYEQRIQLAAGNRFNLGYTIGFDLTKEGKTPQMQSTAPLKLSKNKDAALQADDPEKTYDVKGKAVTTAFNLHLELALESRAGERMEFTGDVAGVFTASARPLQHAKLRTKDLQALRSRATLFYFYFHPTRFEVLFYDPDNTDTPLGVLHADALAATANPGYGSGKWIVPF